MAHDDGLQQTDTRAFHQLSDSGDTQLIFPIDLERTKRNAKVSGCFYIGRSFVYFIKKCCPKKLTFRKWNRVDNHIDYDILISKV